MSMVATERLGRVTGWAGASDKCPLLGGQQSDRPQREVKLEQASKVKSRMPTRPITGEGSTDREDIDVYTCSIRRGSERGMPERGTG